MKTDVQNSGMQEMAMKTINGFLALGIWIVLAAGAIVAPFLWGLGGFIISRLGFLPQDGEMNTVEYENVRFTVLNVEERRIGRVKVEILPKDTDKDSGETDEKKSFFERNRKEDTE